MEGLFWWQYLLVGLTFIWSGFVRSGLGFGGAVLALPFLLLILNKPLVFLPIISIHLLIFSTWITWRGHRKIRTLGGNGSNIDWPYLRHTLKIMIIPKLIGVLGLLTLPGEIMSTIIFAIVICYAIGYVLNRPFRSNSPWLDNLFLVLGGYVSGTSLIGAPLIVAVFATHVEKHKVRDTLFVLWFILVAIKLSSLAIAGVDLQLVHQFWLLPCALAGHLIGERFHQYIVSSETPRFFRMLGAVLIVISLVGISRQLLPLVDALQ